MTVAYLGLFSSILNWVLDKIFTPVFNFLAKLLGSIFTWLFNNVLGPLLEVILTTVFPVLVDILVTALAYILYGVLEMLLTIVDAIMVGFNVLIGMTDVTSGTGAAQTHGKLLEMLFQQNVISRVFLAVTLLGLGIGFLLAIYATLRSTFDFDFEGRRPVGQVLTACFKTGLSFLMVPLFCYFMIHLSGIILNAFDDALNQENLTPGTTIFLISTLEAANDSQYNSNQSFSDPPRAAFISGYGGKTYSYHEVKDVDHFYNVAKIDYVVGYAAAIFMVIILGICMVMFVQRIFEILLLYICSPLFVSTMPLDDGERFSKWRDMFVAKVFTGFGSAIGMRLYLTVLPLIMGSDIQFVTPASAGSYSSSMNYIVKLLFVIGGAWAVYKSSSLLTSLLNFQAAQSEGATAAMVGGFMYGQTAGRMTGMVSSGIHKLTSKSGDKKHDEKLKEAKQEFKERSGGFSGTSRGGAGKIPGLSKPAAYGPKAKNAPTNDASRRFITHGGLRIDRGADNKLRLGEYGNSRFTIGRTEGGGLKVNKFKIAGMKFERGDNGNLSLKSFSTIPGLKFKRSEIDGKMHLSHMGSQSGGMDFAYKQGKDGKAELGNVRAGTWVFGGDNAPKGEPENVSTNETVHAGAPDRANIIGAHRESAEQHKWKSATPSQRAEEQHTWKPANPTKGRDDTSGNGGGSSH